MQLGSLKDSFPCFTRLNRCIAHCSTDSIPWVHHSREEGSLDYDGGFVRLQIHMNFDTNIHRQQPSHASRLLSHRVSTPHSTSTSHMASAMLAGPMRKLSLHARLARRSSPTTLRTPTPPPATTLTPLTSSTSGWTLTSPSPRTPRLSNRCQGQPPAWL
jgi:hypothetical protein